MLNNCYYKLSEKGKLNILKDLLKIESKSKRDLLLRYYFVCGMNKSIITALSVYYNYVKKYKDEVLINQPIFHNELEIYNKILDSLVKLSCELKLTNSLECANLFTYLLWNGYLSKDHELYYDTKKVKLVKGFPFLDIANGYTLCSNNSIVLKDFINKANYSSLVLENQYNNIEKDNLLNIDRKENKYVSLNFISIFIDRIINRNNENHLFTLIKDKSQMYIYDATNLAVFNIESKTKARIINGNGTCRVAPIPSYAYASSQNDNDLLNEYFDYQNEDLYSKDKIKNISDKNQDLFKGNKLIDDFYNDIHNSLNDISKALKKVKSKPNFID